MDDGASWISIIPPVLAIILVISTKKVLLSLGAGVVSAAFIVADYNPLETVSLVWGAFSGIFWADGAVNTYYVYILAFTLMLGMIAALIMMAGGSAAFSEWAVQRIRSRRGAQALAGILGVVIFIDDYFNALAVGQVARPVTDRHRVARAKLAYLIDSTSAPVAVLAPFSSWGASIIGIMAPIVAASTLAMSDVEAFIVAAGMNYYASGALILVALVIFFQLDVGPMRAEEERALVHGETYDDSLDIPGKLAEDLPVHEPGAKRALVIPFLALVLGVLGGIVYTGYTGADEPSWSPLDILASTDVTAALIFGGVLGMVCALYYYWRYTTADPRFATSTLGRGLLEGIRSMAPAVYILLLAWMLGSLISELGTGDYLGGLVEQADISAAVADPGDVRDGRGDGLLHRHLLGLLRHPAADCGRHHELHRRARAAARGLRSRAGGCRVRRPLLADLGHHDPVLHRCQLQRHHARDDPAALRDHRSRGRPHGVCRVLPDPERLDRFRGHGGDPGRAGVRGQGDAADAGGEGREGAVGSLRR